jgi:hypothetical protein
MPDSRDAEAAVTPADNLALTYAMVGDYATAASLAEGRLQARPGVLSIPLMRLDPLWRGFVASPEFEDLARRYDPAH